MSSLSHHLPSLLLCSSDLWWTSNPPPNPSPFWSCTSCLWNSSLQPLVVTSRTSRPSSSLWVESRLRGYQLVLRAQLMLPMGEEDHGADAETAETRNGRGVDAVGCDLVGSWQPWVHGSCLFCDVFGRGGEVTSLAGSVGTCRSRRAKGKRRCAWLRGAWTAGGCKASRPRITCPLLCRHKVYPLEQSAPSPPWLPLRRSDPC